MSRFFYCPKIAYLNSQISLFANHSFMIIIMTFLMLQSIQGKSGVSNPISFRLHLAVLWAAKGRSEQWAKNSFRFTKPNGLANLSLLKLWIFYFKCSTLILFFFGMKTAYTWWCLKKEWFKSDLSHFPYIVFHSKFDVLCFFDV